MLFDEKIEYLKKYETCLKKAKKKNVLLCKVLLICYFIQ